MHRIQCFLSISFVSCRNTRVRCVVVTPLARSATRMFKPAGLRSDWADFLSRQYRGFCRGPSRPDSAVGPPDCRHARHCSSGTSSVVTVAKRAESFTAGQAGSGAVGACRLCPVCLLDHPTMLRHWGRHTLHMGLEFNSTQSGYLDHLGWSSRVVVCETGGWYKRGACKG